MRAVIAAQHLLMKYTVRRCKPALPCTACRVYLWIYVTVIVITARYKHLYKKATVWQIGIQVHVELPVLTIWLIFLLTATQFYGIVDSILVHWGCQCYITLGCWSKILYQDYHTWWFSSLAGMIEMFKCLHVLFHHYLIFKLNWIYVSLSSACTVRFLKRELCLS